MPKTVFSEWFNRQFLNWESERGYRSTLTDFAAWLGFGKLTVSNWLAGKRTPDQDSAERLAVKLGDEVYVILGLLKPSLALHTLVSLATVLSEPEIEKLVSLDEEINQKHQEPKPVNVTNKARSA